MKNDCYYVAQEQNTAKAKTHKIEALCATDLAKQFIGTCIYPFEISGKFGECTIFKRRMNLMERPEAHLASLAGQPKSAQFVAVYADAYTSQQPAVLFDAKDDADVLQPLL